MTIKPHARVKRQADALIDPDLRIHVTHKGVDWITDRFVIVRADMFNRMPAERNRFGTTPKDSLVRRLLGDIPRDRLHAHCLTKALIEDSSRPHGLGLVAGMQGVLFDNRVRPLIEACDAVYIHKGDRIAGFQRRRGSGSLVLVCVVMGVRWDALVSGTWDHS